MYPTTNGFKDAIKSSIINYDVRGEINGVSFGKEDILLNSLSVINQCSNNNEVNIGSVYVGELSVVLLKEMDHYTLVDKTISIECGVLVGNSYEYVSMGIFNIAKATKTKSGLSIKAYDNMSKLDKDFTEQANGTPYEIANFACVQCGVTLANANFDDFVNHDKNLMQHPNGDIETYRDLLYWVAQTICCFATANELGQIEFRAYKTTIDDTLDIENRFDGGQYADYETFYTGISVVNIEEQTTSYYGLTQDDGLTYNLGANPFLQYNDYENARRNILNAISAFKYVPFSISSSANPAYQLGDVLSLPNGLGDSTKKFCITKISWKYGSDISVSGGGENPKLLSVRSKTDKELTALAKSKSDKDVIQYYSFTNMSDIEIADETMETIIDIRYTALKKTVAIFNAEILAEIATKVDGINFYDANAKFYYYFDDTLVERIPAEDWLDGSHIKHLLYYLTTDPGIIHRLQIKCEMNGGSAFIPMGAIKACIYGQNLVASDDWGGILKITEESSEFALIDINFETLSDSVEKEFT